MTSGLSFVREKEMRFQRSLLERIQQGYIAVDGSSESLCSHRFTRELRRFALRNQLICSSPGGDLLRAVLLGFLVFGLVVIGVL